MYQLAKFSRMNVIAPIPYTGPGDIVSGAVGWWGLRAYSSAKRGTNCCRIRRDSDNAEQDFATLRNGRVDRAAISTFLTATTGHFVTFYDQSGAGTLRHLTMATAATQSVVNLSGIGNLVTATFSSSRHSHVGSNWTFTQPITYSWVAISTNTGAEQSLMGDTGNNLRAGYRSSADNQAYMRAGVVLTATATDSVWHSVQCVYNGASSKLNIDGSDTSGNAGTNNATGANFQVGSAGGSLVFSGNLAEWGVWNIGLSGAQCTAMDANQSAFWGY